MKENIDDIIGRYADGIADESEKAWIESQFLNGENNQALRKKLLSDWNLVLDDKSLKEPDLSHVLDRVYHLVRKREQIKGQTFLKRFTRGYIKVAAILLIPVLVAGGLVYNYLARPASSGIEQPVASTIYAPLGSRVSFKLPDGTSGMLNSGSQLTYPIPFTGNRQVSLLGEGWFDVTRDTEHPFEIKTGGSTIRVLGTRFNVSAYPVENYVEVVLQEGKVEYFDNVLGKQVAMVPSERLIARNGKISRTMTDPAKYTAWKDGRLVFNNDPMSEVVRRIERWYNVQMLLADKELENYSFRGTFEDDKLNDVMRLLSLTSPIRYKITPPVQLPDGSYEKEKVTVSLLKRNN